MVCVIIAPIGYVFNHSIIAEDWYKNDYPDEESSSDESESSGTSLHFGTFCHDLEYSLTYLLDAFHEASDEDDELYEDRYNRIIGKNSW